MSLQDSVQQLATAGQLCGLSMLDCMLGLCSGGQDMQVPQQQQQQHQRQQSTEPQQQQLDNPDLQQNIIDHLHGKLPALVAVYRVNQFIRCVTTCDRPYNVGTNVHMQMQRHSSVQCWKCFVMQQAHSSNCLLLNRLPQALKGCMRSRSAGVNPIM